MIRQLLRQMDTFKQQCPLPWRAWGALIPYATLMRWRQRQRDHQPLWQPPGPKKSTPLDWTEFYPLLRQLPSGRGRTPGTGPLYAQFSKSLSRRELAALVQEQRQHEWDLMKRIQWLWSGLAWSCDATEFGEAGSLIIPVQDLASRYRFQPLVTDRLDGHQIAAHLEQLFRRHRPPLFLKRDNGSPFNHHRVDELLARFGVLPLNNPPYFPRYNGAMEKGIRDLKSALIQREQLVQTSTADFSLSVEATVHALNHSPRRCLRGRTACAVFHDQAQHLRWTRRQRQTIFRLLLQDFGATIGSMANDGNHHRPATAWRITVESWLRRQGLISVSQNQNPKVSTTLNIFWSQN
jgi:transposase InsO family protein